MLDHDRHAAELRRIAPVAVAVIALHAALLSIPVRSARPPAPPLAAAVLQVRSLEIAPADSATTRHALASGDGPPSPGEPVAAAAAPAQGPPARAAAADGSPPLPPVGLVKPGGDSDADYYPRAALSLAPTPVDAVVIEYPPIANDSGHHVSQLSLFIDEAGHVTRLRVDGPDLPPALEQAARTAFTAARFRAGMLDGHAVKSHIRIEVEFDSRPPAGQK